VNHTRIISSLTVNFSSFHYEYQPVNNLIISKNTQCGDVSDHVVRRPIATSVTESLESLQDILATRVAVCGLYGCGGIPSRRGDLITPTGP
jgi:hypothetical protein